MGRTVVLTQIIANINLGKEGGKEGGIGGSS